MTLAKQETNNPLVATCTQYSVDFCLAWALIGEWTSRILIPVPKGPWPRHGHAGALLSECQARSPRIVAWARASFEQALPSLLFLQGLVPIFTLLGEVSRDFTIPPRVLDSALR